SLGIQWLLQPARYFSHAQRYLSGSSWLTSARALIMRLSSTDTRAAPRSISPRPVASATGTAAGSEETAIKGLVFGSDQSSIIFSFLFSRLFTGRLRIRDRRWRRPFSKRSSWRSRPVLWQAPQRPSRRRR